MVRLQTPCYANRIGTHATDTGTPKQYSAWWNLDHKPLLIVNTHRNRGELSQALATTTAVRRDVLLYAGRRHGSEQPRAAKSQSQSSRTKRYGDMLKTHPDPTRNSHVLLQTQRCASFTPTRRSLMDDRSPPTLFRWRFLLYMNAARSRCVRNDNTVIQTRVLTAEANRTGTST